MSVCPMSKTVIRVYQRLVDVIYYMAEFETSRLKCEIEIGEIFLFIVLFIYFLKKIEIKKINPAKIMKAGPGGIL